MIGESKMPIFERDMKDFKAQDSRPGFIRDMIMLIVSIIIVFAIMLVDNEAIVEQCCR